MKRLFLLLALCIGCGGQTGNITIAISVSPSDDPFVGAATVRITVGDTMHVATAPVSGGHFSVTYKRPPAMTNGTITVEALDSGGKVIAHGSTPPIALTAMDQQVVVWVGRPGKTQPGAASLPSPRSQIAGVNVPGLGAMLAGGLDGNDMPMADNEIYDVFTQAMIQTSMMSKPRAGTSIASVGSVHAIVFGGATGAASMGTTPVDASMELFDPTTGLGVWSPVPVTGFAARTQASHVQLGSGNTLISGGLDTMGMPIGTAAMVAASGTVTLTAIASPMVAPRAGHAVAPAHFSDGDGALLFGGLPPGSTAPAAERLVGQAFSAYDLGMPNRRGATATTMASGAIVILGGIDDAGATLDSGFVVTPNVPPAVSPLPMPMSAPRSGHTAMVSGGELIVCGGSDANDMALASCDVFDGSSFALKRSFNLAAARTGHTAVVLDNGEAILAGGIGSDDKPLASVEIYTP